MVTLECNYPLTEEQTDMLLDRDMKRTSRVEFTTKHGKAAYVKEEMYKAALALLAEYLDCPCSFGFEMTDTWCCENCEITESEKNPECEKCWNKVIEKRCIA